jgi:hypothetical protein
MIVIMLPVVYHSQISSTQDTPEFDVNAAKCDGLYSAFDRFSECFDAMGCMAGLESNERVEDTRLWLQVPFCCGARELCAG